MLNFWFFIKLKLLLLFICYLLNGNKFLNAKNNRNIFCFEPEESKSPELLQQHLLLLWPIVNWRLMMADSNQPQFHHQVWYSKSCEKHDIVTISKCYSTVKHVWNIHFNVQQVGGNDMNDIINLYKTFVCLHH